MFQQLIQSIFSSTGNNLSKEDLLKGTVIDVRSPAEFQQGHAKGSINIPLQQIDRSLLKIRQMNQPIITCCRSGNRSGMATRQLNSNGIESINGGTWQNVQEQMAQ
ncbi:rhodanese-like domain-containing protein [Neolewinella persica]|uniref:rhodanese-like domain-containing protein n=1 Tax=Neolewinella persica TaxID=70998 RepID=UPI0003820BCD|nr:rhodanese-like domain-containing protein [Neolewinella persica]